MSSSTLYHRCETAFCRRLNRKCLIRFIIRGGFPSWEEYGRSQTDMPQLIVERFPEINRVHDLYNKDNYTERSIMLMGLSVFRRG